MAKKKNITVRNAILCEYVARGSNNKHVLVNVYSGDIIVSKLPAEINLGVYLELERAEGASVDEITFEIKLGNESILTATAQNSSESKLSVLALHTIRVEIKSDTIFKVIVSASGYADTTAIAKQINLGKIPSITT